MDFFKIMWRKRNNWYKIFIYLSHKLSIIIIYNMCESGYNDGCNL